MQGPRPLPPLLEVNGLVQEFDLTKGLLAKAAVQNGRLTRESRVVHAVNDVSFRVDRGKVLSLVGSRAAASRRRRGR